MPRPEKVQAVEEIREQLDEARATFVTEYRGLTVSEQQQLRRNVRQAQGEYKVLKMSLARRAVEDMALEGLVELLAGPTALAFAGNDPVPVAKALKDFASDHEKLIIKGGILGGALLPPEQISRLADIEPREVLLSKIAGGFKAPLSKLAGAFGAKLRDAASVFSQLLDKKEEETPAPAAEEAPAVEAVEVPEAVAEAAEEAPEAAVEEAPAVEADEVPETEVEAAPAAEAEEAAEVAEETPEPVAEESPEPVAEETPEPETAEEPEPKKKAAPKAKVKKSPAKAAADKAATDESDETAEEE